MKADVLEFYSISHKEGPDYSIWLDHEKQPIQQRTSLLTVR